MKETNKSEDIICNYGSIINLEHHKSSVHPHMSLDMRAAQFAPFAALTGYNEFIKEAARITKNKIVLMDEEVDLINNNIKKAYKDKIKCEIIYYIPDSKKNGGEYKKIEGIIKKIDYNNKKIFTENIIIKMNDIYKINLL